MMMDLSQIFSDITPIPQNDGPHPVCAIDYPEKFVEAMDYMRALMDVDEHSERALRLTKLCLEFNPANYTIWWYRRQILSALSIQGKETVTTTSMSTATSNSSCTYYDLEYILNDLELASDLGGSNPKNYQIWYHRRSLLEYTFEMIHYGNKDGIEIAKDELKYIEQVLKEDAKNYHAWSHRQWILRTVNSNELWSNEVEYLESLIEQDIRNNSAWNQRWFANHHGDNITFLSRDNAHSEAEFAIQYAAMDPHNESPLRYLVALVREQMKKHQGSGSISSSSSDFTTFLNFVEKEIENLRETLNRGDDCASLISAYIDVLEMKNDSNSLLKAVEMANNLGTKFDVIRNKYWLMREKKLKSKALLLS